MSILRSGGAEPLRVGLFAGCALLLGASAAHGATYTGSYSVDPATFHCAFYGSVEACGVSGPLQGGPRQIQAGDHLTETVTFSSSVSVPGSATQSLVYFELFDAKVPNGPAIPGNNQAYVVTQMHGYSGPPGFYTAYTSSPLHKYTASGGFSGAASPGFSLDGFTSDFYVMKGDPDPIIGYDYGYFVALPYTPQVISDLAGGPKDAPRILPAGHIGSITNAISGGAAPSAQYYSFLWGGGDFSTIASITGANPQADFHYQLLDAVTHDLLLDLGLDASNGFSRLMRVNGLSKGLYELGLYTDSPYDPQFTITFNSPVLSAAPEPAVWLMMLLGFGLCGVTLRRRARRAPPIQSLQWKPDGL